MTWLDNGLRQQQLGSGGTTMVTGPAATAGNATSRHLDSWAGGRHALEPVGGSPAGLRPWLPLLAALTWMLGTFGAFWLGGQAELVPNPGRLCLFVLGATAVFALGYVARILRHPPRERSTEDPVDQIRRAHRLVFWGACYYTLLGAALLVEYGASGPGNIMQSIMSPAEGYASKFEIYQMQQDAGRVSLPIQILTLLAVLSTALVPLLVVYWRTLPPRLRAAGLVGLGVYVLFFLYIGTLKGLGDTVVMVLAGLMITSVAGLRGRSRRRPPRRGMATAMATVVLVLFGWYMVSNQAARASLFGTEDVMRPSPAVERVIGHEAATGVAATIFYPTHGYLGLAYNLETPFAWSRGLGAAPAAASYANQYLGADSTAHPAYPARTEARTGWPAGLYWSTAYPWLASDLTFPGVVALMGLIGWFLARFWTEAAYGRRILSMLIFVQLGLLIAYLPANNQLGASRPSMIGMATLLVLYAWAGISRRLRAQEPTDAGAFTPR
ncbi:hypothetical protein [Micromonospora sp. IBSANI012]|uniref:hypothetical protein n=1 Tax=Micromonospora sp. IBSANI012 TaxID=3457761 RepID=UPI004059D4F6